MPAGSASTSLSITNPLVLYRALIATNKIKPDPAQHRLALQLQKLYYSLKDYSPELEYRHRLDQISQSIPNAQHVTQQRSPVAESAAAGSRPIGGLLSSLLRDSSGNSMLALTKTIPIHDSAKSINSPQGMLLYGEVGRGKSMLLDLLYTSLPSRKKRRWHFNTFMLDVFRRLERARIHRAGKLGIGHEHVVLSLAKDIVSKSPILFLDEFQMPDRASSKLVNTFMTAFFHLGGVLVASSNRMPDELAKASGIEFGGSRQSGRGFFGWSLARISEGQRAAQSDFGQFLEVLKARCEVWEMEGERDWRRDDGFDETISTATAGGPDETDLDRQVINSDSMGSSVETAQPEFLSSDAPPHYHITLPSDSSTDGNPFVQDLQSLNPTQSWTPAALSVYGRTIRLPQTHNGIASCSFSSLCAAHLGPADYVSICSTFHTMILHDVPVLTVLQKNEARRFITLLDALYEARCRLLISAAAPPDKLFFPEARSRSRTNTTSSSSKPSEESDSIVSEAFSEMYQDSTAPFRPNISSYTTDTDDHSATPTTFPSNPTRRSVLADEDADFGLTYGHGRGYNDNSNGMADLERRQGPDFTDTSALTGEDEKFAYRRARSRLWEMCGRRWWTVRATSPVEEWWTPVTREGRFWEAPSTSSSSSSSSSDGAQNARNGPGARHKIPFRQGDESTTTTTTTTSTSPFRTRTDPPPKFGWQHAWGMMRWGKKAGEWGKGVDGLRQQQQKKDGQWGRGGGGE